MEEGKWDEANAEKIRLEEKQRAVRIQQELECEENKTPSYTPTWFKPVLDPCNDGEVIHQYQGGYWEAKDTQDWSMCRDIF